ncbi:hypothetical protein Q757_05325 [Oenococcus alcoholitolerans]|uniref:Solute-binding protein family 3/N-terminal domain-containing protein n=1 Tax=Oenococcus alcoholitolerans TaxID=931074 RepID=A0ABR4XQT7_9LACO|nr:hypothetical protein Q757_05325 [Oenococcus alcoholitolerans]
MLLITIVMTTLFLSMIQPTAQAKTQNPDQIYSKIKKRGYLIVGLSADYAPMEFHSTINGQDKIIGSDISLAQKAAKDMGVRLEIKEMNFDNLIGALTTGKIDLSITGMVDTPEREKIVDFHIPIITNRQSCSLGGLTKVNSKNSRFCRSKGRRPKTNDPRKSGKRPINRGKDRISLKAD